MSDINAPDGVGFGLYAKALEAGSVAFIENEPVLNIQGCLALRTKQEDGRFLEWLYADNMICGLASSRYVMWSDVYCNIGSDYPLVEIGFKTDDLSVFSNDSQTRQQANIKNTGFYFREYHCSKEPVSFSRHDIPAWFKLIARRDILDGEELCWHYAQKEIKSPDYSTRNFTVLFDPVSHFSQIEQWTKALIRDTGSLEVLKNEQTFDHLRWEKQFKVYIPPLTFSEEERHYHALIEAGRANEVLGRSSQSKAALNAYIKYQLLNSISDLPKLMVNLVRTLNNHNHGYNASSLFDYCLKESFLSAQTSIPAIPYQWLAQKMKENPDSSELLYLLQCRLRRSVIEPNFKASSIIEQLNIVQMPNPLKEGRCEWHLCDLLSIAQHPGNILRNEALIRETLEKYHTDCDVNTGSLVSMLAQMGSLDAIQAILEKRCMVHKRPLADVSDAFLANGTRIPLCGQMQLPTKENLIAFIRERYSPEKCSQLLSVFDASEEELALKLADNPNCRAVYGKRFKQQILEAGSLAAKMTIFKKYLAFYGNSDSPVSTEVYLRNAKRLATHIPELEETIDKAFITNLFPEAKHKDWLTRRFTTNPDKDKFQVNTLSDSELLEKVATVDTKVNPWIGELLRRGQTNQLLWGDILLASRKACHSDNRAFCRRMAGYFTDYSYPSPSGNEWHNEDIRTLYAVANKNGLAPAITDYSGMGKSEWLDFLKSHPKMKTRCGTHYKKAINSMVDPAEKQTLLTDYLEICCKINLLGDYDQISKRMAGINFPNLKKPYRRHALFKLFTPEEQQQPWMATHFPYQTKSDDELVEELKSHTPLKHQQLWMEAWLRAKDHPDFLPKVIEVFPRYEKENDAKYSKRLKAQLDRYGLQSTT